MPVKRIRKDLKNFNFLSTGSLLFDLVLGGWGYPVGKIVNLVGDKSTGKTLLSIELIAEARRVLGKKLKWFYDDAEAGFSFDTEMMYGFKIVADDSDCSFTVEDFDANLQRELSLLKDDEYLIYVLDSLDSLTTEAELKRIKKEKKEKETGDDVSGSYKLEKQKFMSEFFRLRRRELKNKKCILVIVSQVRVNIGVSFGRKLIRLGGKALDFYAACVIWLSESEKYYKKKRCVGICVKAKCDKNKVGKPFRECFIDILFDYGIDNITSNIIFLYDLKTDKGKNKALKDKKIKWDNKEFNVLGLVRYIEKNNLEDELKNRVVEKWDEIENSISSNGRKSRWD